MPSRAHVLHIAYGIMPFRGPERHFFIGKIQEGKGKAERCIGKAECCIGTAECCIGKAMAIKVEGL